MQQWQEEGRRKDNHQREDLLREEDRPQRNLVFFQIPNITKLASGDLYESEGRLTTIQPIADGIVAWAVVALLPITIFVWRIGFLNCIFGGALLLGFLLLIKPEFRNSAFCFLVDI